MTKIKALVFSGYGLNCEEETKFAFELAGAKTEIIHINDLIDNPKKMEEFQIMAFPGGFSYGDDTGSGNAFANKLRNHLWKNIDKFVNQDKMAIGVCNGFQIMVNLGLLPALSKKYGDRQVALLPNTNARYTVRWVDLKIENKSPWLKGIKQISLPIAHGEGRFYANDEILNEMNRKNLIAARYIKGEICNHMNLEYNPNGALDDVAAITDETGKLFGIMPHPERAVFFRQLPHWTYLREKAKREGKRLPEFNDGLKIFKNAVNYFK